jgi:hypothetical protein
MNFAIIKEAHQTLLFLTLSIPYILLIGHREMGAPIKESILTDYISPPRRKVDIYLCLRSVYPVTLETKDIFRSVVISLCSAIERSNLSSLVFHLDLAIVVFRRDYPLRESVSRNHETVGIPRGLKVTSQHVAFCSCLTPRQKGLPFNKVRFTSSHSIFMIFCDYLV